MPSKTLAITSTITLVLTITLAVLSFIGVAFTGFYPGMIILWLLPLIPIASKYFGMKRLNSNGNYVNRYNTALTVLNLLTILVVLWMTMVIVHDRVLKDCC